MGPSNSSTSPIAAATEDAVGTLASRVVMHVDADLGAGTAWGAPRQALMRVRTATGEVLQRRTTSNCPSQCARDRLLAKFDDCIRRGGLQFAADRIVALTETLDSCPDITSLTGLLTGVWRWKARGPVDNPHLKEFTMITVDVLQYGMGLRTDRGTAAFCTVALISGTRRTLVDFGHVGRRNASTRHCVSVVWRPSDIDVTVATHAHWDHIQNLDVFTGAPMLIHPLRAEIRAGSRTQRLGDAVVDGCHDRDAAQRDRSRRRIRNRARCNDSAHAWPHGGEPVRDRRDRQRSGRRDR